MATTQAEIQAAIAAVQAESPAPTDAAPPAPDSAEADAAPVDSGSGIAEEAVAQAGDAAASAAPEAPKAVAPPAPDASDEVPPEWLEKLEADSKSWRSEQQRKQEKSELDQLRQERAEQEALRQRDPLEYARKYLGDDFYDKITRRLLNDGKLTAEEKVKHVETEAERLKRENDELRTKISQKDQETHVNQYLGDVSKVLDQPQYALTREWPGIQSDIIDLTNKWHSAYGQVLTPQEVVSKIDVIVRQRWRRLKQAEGAASPEEKKAPEAPPKQTQHSGQASTPRTITNDMASVSDVELPDDLSWDERKARVAKLITWD